MTVKWWDIDKHNPKNYFGEEVAVTGYGIEFILSLMSEMFKFSKWCFSG